MVIILSAGLTSFEQEKEAVRRKSETAVANAQEVVNKEEGNITAAEIPAGTTESPDSTEKGYTIDNVESIILPPVPEKYLPEVQYTPLFSFGDPNSPLMNFVKRSGEGGVQKQIFTDREGNLFYLPDDAVDYKFYGSFYAIYNKDGQTAIMNLQGEVLTGYDYYSTKVNPAGAYYIERCAQYIVLQKLAPDKDESGNERYLSGIFDIAAGVETSPFIYDDIIVINEYFVAFGGTGDSLKIIDASGAIWYDTGTNEYSIEHMTDADLNLLGTTRQKYMFFGNSKAVFLTIDEGSAIGFADKAFSIRTGKSVDGYIYDLYTLNGDLIGEEIYRIAFEAGGGEALLLCSDAKFLVLEEDGILEIPDTFTIKGERNPGSFKITPEGHFEIRMYQKNSPSRLVTIDKNGQIQSVKIAEEFYPGPEGFLQDETHRFHPVTNPNKTYHAAFKCGLFVFAIAGDGSVEKRGGQQDIYDLNGNLLMENPVAVTDANFECFEDRIVVFKDSETCGFLFEDGRFEQIEGVPQVSFVPSWN